MPPSEREAAQPCSSERGEIFVVGAYNGTFQYVSLELHQPIVSRGSSVRMEGGEITGFMGHDVEDIGDLEGDGFNGSERKMRSAAAAVESGDIAACLTI